ncbi:peroxiredoxin, Ohr subfamily [Deinococcus proteolyticus MRP]|uniref:Peroxiredoxin, Ohr subfamily n=1 Tax=Deinococcus proteolyticus (strain ATCC 35074 / DSM 20540 / JCM 6276 / NBRC 101906 / NCIMB 13154 / VKM Ac-1939 / CCM 2703 / MRP) TaxID=693977 RepID=F0RM51_DEIPM|nr:MULTISPECIES: organic hydroperoxide resistance protein [Deinococcus]ADY25971.1 peroxiredoxin, Ohr subfamily [Deinococcus proteolyticus MRP]MCY1702092.1 organic hydroperoxide resistance protein [Deinococcus sp. SL84]
MANLYETTVKTQGARGGTIQSEDGRLQLDLSVPKALGGDDGQGTNPEQLFAAGYGACFQGAMGLVARRQGIQLPEGSSITATVGMEKDDVSFLLNAHLVGRFPGMDREQAQKLMEETLEVCPYSRATKGNMQTSVSVAD